MNLPAQGSSITDSRERDLLTIREISDVRIAPRLMSMGVMPGRQVEILRIAPWKGGFCLKVNGQKIAIRYEEAASILVE